MSFEFPSATADRVSGNAGYGLGEAGGVEVFDVALAGVDFVDLAGIDIETEDGEILFGEGQREGQADVAEADDAHQGGSISYFRCE